MGQKKRTKRLIKPFRKAVEKCRMVAKEIYFRTINRHSKKPVKQENRSDVIITLTTFPARINRVFITIESLLRQKLPPAEIHLWLSADEINAEHLPKSLKRLIKRGLKVSFMAGNLKSYKKLVYALKEYPENILVTVDDDIMYPSHWLEQLYETHKKHPEDIICHRAHYLLLDENDRLLPYKSLIKKGGEEIGGDEASYALLPTGASGILYPPHALHALAVNDEQFMRLAPMADDIWFKCCALLNNKKTRRVKPLNSSYDMVLGTKDSGLYKKNVKQGFNDEQLKQVFCEFDIINKYLKK